MKIKKALYTSLVFFITFNNFCSHMTSIPYIHESQISLKYGKFAIKKSKEELNKFKKEHNKNFNTELSNLLIENINEGCTRGIINRFNKKEKSSLIINSLIGKKFIKDHSPKDLQFSIWLWSTKKTKNKKLGEIMKLFCINPKKFCEIVTTCEIATK